MKRFLDEGWLNVRPVIPVLNRWNKVYGPMCFWLFAIKLSAIGVKAFLAVGKSANTREDVIVNVDLIGPVSEEAFRKTNRVRWNRASDWLGHDNTGTALSVGSALFGLTLPFLGLLFDAPRSLTCGSVQVFLSLFTSPAEKTLMSIGRKLTNDTDVVWAPLQPFTESSVHNGSTGALGLCGEIFLRNVMVPSMHKWRGCVCGGEGRGAKSDNQNNRNQTSPNICYLLLRFWWDQVWELWPWPLGELLLDDVLPARKIEIKQAFWRVRRCCTPTSDGFTWPLRVAQESEASVDSEETRRTILDGVNQAPITNVPLENMFARHRTHVSSCMGNPPSASTIAADHFLSQFQSLYHDAVANIDDMSQDKTRSARTMDRRPEESSQRLTGYNAFVKSKFSQRAEGPAPSMVNTARCRHPMVDVAAEWQAPCF